MANIFINFVGDKAQSLVASIERVSDHFYKRSDSPVFVSGLAFADKAIALTEGLVEDIGTYRAIVAADTWQDGMYMLRIHDTNDGNNVIGADTIYIKDGSESAIGDVDVYHADIQFIRAPNADQYTVTWFKNSIQLTAGITSVSLQVIKRSDGSNLVANSGMLPIGSSGSYKLDIANPNRQLEGESYIVVSSLVVGAATRKFSWILGRDAL